MTPCWPPGALRAHLDGELPPPDSAALAAHLELCPTCAALFREIAGRAGRVAGVLRALAPAPSARRRALAFPRRLAAGAIAAALALWVLPSRPPAPPHATATLQPFIFLDHEPIDTGLVVRVALGPDRIPADVIVGPDGRPRAYRLVSNLSEGVNTE